MTDLEYVVSRLKFLLRQHAKTPPRSRRIEYTSLPLNTTIKLDHVPLSRVMSPAMPEDCYTNEAVFDTWLYPIIDSASIAGSIADLAGKSAETFVMLGDSFNEQTTRLLFACGNAHGASLSVGPRSMMVTHGDREFGIHNGQVVSRFCSSLKIPDWDPTETMSRVRRVPVYHAGFCSLYREAYRRKVESALIALHMGQPKFNYEQLAEDANPKRLPGRSKFTQWEEILASPKDPVGRLYRSVVPGWMTHSDFCKVVGPLHARPFEPGFKMIQRISNKLYDHFYRPKEQQ